MPLSAPGPCLTCSAPGSCGGGGGAGGRPPPPLGGPGGGPCIWPRPSAVPGPARPPPDNAAVPGGERVPEKAAGPAGRPPLFTMVESLLVVVVLRLVRAVGAGAGEG